MHIILPDLEPMKVASPLRPHEMVWEEHSHVHTNSSIPILDVSQQKKLCIHANNCNHHALFALPQLIHSDNRLCHQ